MFPYWKTIWRQENDRPRKEIIFANAFTIFALTRVGLGLAYVCFDVDVLWFMLANMGSLALLFLLLTWPNRKRA